MNIRWRPRREAIPPDAIAAAPVVRKGKPGGESVPNGEKNQNKLQEWG
jgi:hypothetical protein